MKTSGNTILITGGGSGIGYELASILSENHNTVIITGRNEQRLVSAVKQLRNVSAYVSDVTDEKDVNHLADQLYTKFPDLNVVINNAARAIMYDITKDGVNVFEKAKNEIATNFLSVVRLNEKLLPLLRNKEQAAIVNVSSIGAFLPGRLVGYAASKAALHSYTLSLRMALENNPGIKVFELVPPLVNTEFSKDIGGSRGISPQQVAREFMSGFENNQLDIRVGQAEQIYQLQRTSIEEAQRVLRQVLQVSDR